MNPANVEPALLAKKRWEDAIDKFFVAGVALKQAPSAEMKRVLENAHEDLVRLEEEAVKLDRAAYARLSKHGVLEVACIDAKVPSPLSSEVADVEAWQSSLIGRVSLSNREEARLMVASAIRLAGSGRLLSATLVLTRLEPLLDT